MAGLTNGCVALVIGQHAPAAATLLPALAVGAICYGASIVLDVYALRLLGAAREAAFFAAAPFVGALLAVPLLHEIPQPVHLGGAVVMVTGVSWLVRRGLRQPPPSLDRRLGKAAPDGPVADIHPP